MNAQEQAVIAARLETALEGAGVEVQRGTFRHGNISGHERVNAHALVAAWIRLGWWVVLEEKT